MERKQLKISTINFFFVLDDAAGVKLNDKPHQIAVIESLTTKTLIGSGLTMSRRAQLENLSRNAALSVERWMTSMMVEKRWFGGVSKSAERWQRACYRIKLPLNLVSMAQYPMYRAACFGKLKLVALRSWMGSQVFWYNSPLIYPRWRSSQHTGSRGIAQLVERRSPKP